MTLSRSLAVTVLATLLLLICAPHALHAQSDDARITGIVTDSAKAVIRGAKVDLINVATGVRYATVTNEAGVYRVSGQVGTYRLEIEHSGFKTVIAPNIALHTQDALQINIEMAVGSTEESVTVDGGATNDSPAVSMTVEREFVENMPLNGRSFQDLIQLAPGTVDSSLGGSGSGYYSINGQRTDSNNYTVDGVSANLGGVNNYAGADAGLSGNTPTQTVLGTTQSLASVDSLQEFTIQTSGYNAEFGRSPGGQVQITTRSGTNDLHGTAFDYFRNTALDANSYSNDYDHLPQTAEHQNDFGGTLGGPIRIPRLYDGRGKSFYFLSYEGLRLLLPSFESEYVPTPAFRQWASPAVQPYLNAYPRPNSTQSGDNCTVPNSTPPAPCDEQFNYGYSYPNNLDSISIRVDHNFGRRLRAFARYADTPSSKRVGAELTSSSLTNVHNWTGGLTATITSGLLDELRFNYSHDGEQTVGSQESIGGSIPFPRSLLIPAAYDAPYAEEQYYLSVPGSAISRGFSYAGTGTMQHQWQVLDSLTWVRGKHSIKFGGDWRRLMPEWTSDPYRSSVRITSLADFQNGIAASAQIYANAPGQPIFDNLSLYVQDHWKVSPRLSVDYGLRWDFNPPPGPSNGHYPVTLTSSNLATATLAPTGTPPYDTDYHSFGPRFGFAWNANQSAKHTLTVRGGFGIFFDTGQQAIAGSYETTYPFGVSGPRQTNLALPLSDAELAPPSLNVPLVPPYPFLNGMADPQLTSPYSEQWNLSLDEAFDSKNTFTISYVGNNGRKLLFSQEYDSVPGNPNLTGLYFTNNEAQSSYNALQLQDTGRIFNGLDIVGSFTWAHALDNASTDNVGTVPFYGNSSNDLRRVLNLALNYTTPQPGYRNWGETLTRGWVLANRFSAQSGYPLNVVQDEVDLDNGSLASYSPDLVQGVPVYLHGSAANLNGLPVPGNWRLNSDALAVVPADPSTSIPIRQGTLGRNFLRTPPLWTLNTSLQRSFPIHEELHLNFHVDAFNIFNHPNLTIINSLFPAPNFGTSTGGAGTIGSSNALYATGAARSLQLGLKLQF